MLRHPTDTSAVDACKSLSSISEYPQFTFLLASDRFESGMLPEPPDVLTSPKFEDLLMHCVKEHPAIWSDLRCKRDLEAPPS